MVWIAIFSSFSYPWELNDTMMGAGGDMFAEIETIATPVITWGFEEGVAYTAGRHDWRCVCH